MRVHLDIIAKYKNRIDFSGTLLAKYHVINCIGVILMAPLRERLSRPTSISIKGDGSRHGLRGMH
jgi:hypothetical protein